MAESRQEGRFWFKAAMADKDARNSAYKERVGMVPHQAMYGEKKVVSDFKAFGCRAWVYLDKQKESIHHEQRRLSVLLITLVYGHAGF